MPSRILNAAWNQLDRKELTDFSFPELAREAGVTTAAIYPYFPNVGFLIADLIALGFKTFFRELGQRFDPVFSQPTARHYVRATLSDIFRFAERRPRLYALMLSYQYGGRLRFPAVGAHRSEFRQLMEQLLTYELGHSPSRDELQTFWVIVQGNASIFTNRDRRKRKLAFAMLEQFFDAHRSPSPSVNPVEVGAATH